MDVVIHVGLAKTGSTFLTRKVFEPSEHINLIEQLKLSYSFMRSKVNVVSNDGLGGYAFPKYDSGGEANGYILADRFHKLFPDAKIIICTRKREDWLNSLYRHYVKYGGHLKYNDWYKEVLDKEYIKVNKYVNYLRSLFDEILVLRYEQLKKDKEAFVKKVCEFINIPVPEIKYDVVNPGWNDKQVMMGLFCNKFFRSKFNPDGKLPYHWSANPRWFINRLGDRRWMN